MYPERKPTSPAKRKAYAASKETRARKDSLSPRAEKEQGGEKRTRAETESVSSMSLQSPIHALASAGESDHRDTFVSTVEEQEQAMCKFSSLFEETPDLSMDGGEMLLLEASTHVSLESDTSDGVPSLIYAHDLPSPSSTYDLETYLSPFTPTEPTCTTYPLPDFDTTPEAEPSKPLSLSLPAFTDTPASPGRCTCITHALTAFHDAPPLTDILAPSAVEAALAGYKKTLSAYEAVLRCESCCASTSAAITALVISDELLANLSRLRAALRPHSIARRVAASSSFGGDVDMDVPLLLCGDPLATRGLAVGAYAVDSRREWAGVMDALVGVQLQRLERVLVLLRVRGEGGVQEGEVRGLVVGRLEERLRGVVGRG
ncbi:hypothetical protein P171DRAFT_444510 [Karstenula rhodostoma CBS 690.94]|uniref:Aflatoxin regulatory protein domain-containing protein n=1 Tax=Karstenula rhodostoma CBS 690.94 TaxID=1392251 RepID=A0A9P4UBM8_9PLEO|nr:hypothetical protein P171DRAFT_444510 [Karstenula rhodostoma CBS 690.94]